MAYLAIFRWNSGLVFLIALLLAPLASAQSPQGATPTFSKVFAPDTIGPGSTTTLTFTITNPDTVPREDLAFTDTLPAGVTIAAPANASTDCLDAILTATSGGGTITFSDGGLGAMSSCTVSVNVTSSSIGTHMNVSGALMSDLGMHGTASDDLMVVTTLPGFTKVFSPSTTPLGSRSTLTLTIDNSNNASNVLNLDFTDILPSELIIATPSNASTTCGTATIPPTLTAAAGSSFITLDADGTAAFPAVAAGATCTVIVDVVSTGSGMLGNVSGDLLAGFVTAGKASAVLDVTTADLVLIKEFIDDPTPQGGTVTLEFTIMNFTRDDTATMISFSDTLPASLTPAAGETLPKPACGGTLSFAGGVLTLTGGTVAPELSCTFSVMLDVPPATATGSYPNTTGAITSSLGTGNMASDTLFVAPAPVLTKEFVGGPVVAGDDATIRFTITNTSATSMATDIEFLDELTDGSGGFPPDTTSGFLPSPVSVTLPPTPDPPCNGSGSLDLVSAGASRQALELTGGVLAAGAMCSFDVLVTIPDGFPPGTYTNFTEEITATVGADTVTGNPASADLVVIAAPTLSKAFTDDPVAPDGTVTLEFTLTYNPNATADATVISFTDNLTFLTGLTGDGMTVNDVCGTGNGTLSWSAGDTLLTFMGATLMPGESCTFSVTLDVPMGAAPGGYTNTTSDVSATVGGMMVTSPAASDVLDVSGLTFSKEFLPDLVVAGQTITLRFTIDNVHPTEDATITFFTDNLAADLAGLAATGGATMDTCGGSLSGTTFLTYVGGSVSSGTSCIIEVPVLVPAAAADGAYSNITSSLSATQGGVVVVPPAVDILTVTSDLLVLEKDFTDDPVAPGSTVTLEFRLENLDPSNAISAIAFTDVLTDALAGLTFDSLLFNDCGATVTGTGTGTITVSGGSLGAGGTCTIRVSVGVMDPSPAGVFTNTTSPPSYTVGGVGATGTAASDDLRVNNVLFTKSFDGPTVQGGTPSVTFTLTNLGTTAVSGLSFSDNFDAVISGLAATSLPSTPCGAGSSLSGSALVTMTGGSLAASGSAGDSCMFSIPLLVPSMALAGDFLNTTSELFSGGGGLKIADPATDTLSVQPPPLFDKTFSPDSIGVGQTSMLTFSIDNTASSVIATDLAFTDTLPAGLSFTGVPSDTCGGSFSLMNSPGLFPASVPPDMTLTYSGGSVAAGGTCSVTATVLGILPGMHLNTSGDLTSSSGNSGTASDTLTVNPTPGFDKVFAPNPIDAGDVSTLTFTIDNSGSSVAATSLSFSDSLPTNVIIATPSGAATTCTGGTLTAPDGGSTIMYSGGSVSAGASCTISVDVTSDTPGTHMNVSGALTSNLGSSGTSSDDLVVNAFDPLTFSKAFMPTPIAPGATSTLMFTIGNTNGVAIGNLDFSDTLPTNVVIATPSMASTTCTSGTLTAPDGGSTISYTGGSVGASSSCTVSVDVTSTVPGTYTNTSGDLTSDTGNSGTASDDLVVNDFGDVVFAKSFSPNPIDAGDTSTLTFTIDNSTNLAAVGNLDFSDTLPANVVIATPANASTDCTGGTLTAPAGGSTISYTGGTVAASSSCTVMVDVTSDTPGTHTNTSGDLTSDAGNSGTATDDLVVNAFDPLGFGKSFSPDPIEAGDSSTLTFSIDNGNGVVIGNLAFSDTLPANVIIATPANAATTCTGGTLTAPAGGSTISYTGGTVAASSSCTVSVDVTSATVATHTNVSGALTSDAGNSGTATDTLTVNAPPIVDLRITKSPDTQTVATGNTATFSIAVRNEGTTTITNISVSDPLTTDCDRALGAIPDLAPSEDFSYTCQTGALTTGFVNKATASGESEGDPISASDTAQVTVVTPDLGIAKTPDTQSVDPGDTATFTITITNNGSITLTNIAVDDPLTMDCDRTAGSLMDLDPGEMLSYMCTTEALFADLTNEATASADGVGSQSDTAFVDVIQPVEITKEPGEQEIPNGSKATFTIRVTNPGSGDLTSVEVSDPATPDCNEVIGTLAGGTFFEYNCETDVLFNDLTNTATVTAEDSGGDPVTAFDTANVFIVSEEIEATKETGTPEIFPGESVTFTITIANVGSGMLTNISVDDPLTPDCDRSAGDLPDLDPTESTSYTCDTGPLFADLTNVATITAELVGGASPLEVDGSSPAGPVVIVQAVAQAVVLVVSPDIDIEKTTTNMMVSVGAFAEFTIEITNTGVATITDLEVDDPLTPDCSRAVGTLPDLAPGASTSYTCKTLPLMEGQGFTNVATVMGILVAGDPVSASDSAEVVVVSDADAIPTLGEWGILTLLALLGGAGAMMLRRRSA